MCRHINVLAESWQRPLGSRIPAVPYSVTARKKQGFSQVYLLAGYQKSRKMGYGTRLFFGADELQNRGMKARVDETLGASRAQLVIRRNGFP